LPSNLPGQRELELMCDNARRVAAFCELLAAGVVDDDQELLHQTNRLQRALTSGLELELQAEHDPDVHPYVWDE
jgi:hypothetical protein